MATRGRGMGAIGGGQGQSDAGLGRHPDSER